MICDVYGGGSLAEQSDLVQHRALVVTRATDVLVSGLDASSPYARAPRTSHDVTAVAWAVRVTQRRRRKHSGLGWLDCRWVG